MDLIVADVVILLCCLAVTLYLYGRKISRHFDGTDVKHVKPTVPYFGSAVKVFLHREHFRDFLVRNYDLFPGERYVGLFEGPKPLILLRDVDLIRRIGVKDFDCFPDHRSIVDKDMDSMFGSVLFSLHGDKWRDMRATLTPAFTGAKMRSAFVFAEACAREVARFCSEECDRSGSPRLEIDCHDVFTRYANDVIANSAFGVRVNSLKDRENAFYSVARLATRISRLQTLKYFFYSLFPRAMKLLGVEFISANAKQFLRDLMGSTMRVREHNSIVRIDMIHLLMEARSGLFQYRSTPPGPEERRTKWADEELFAQGLVFLLGGLDSTSILIAYLFYELARDPRVMRRAVEEIERECPIPTATRGLSYSDLQRLEYLDACVSETLRMWPPALAVDRVCSRPYELPPPSARAASRPYLVEPGHAVWIPIYCLHRDPDHFPEPDRFLPERFLGRSPSSHPAYMPFGLGPRNCIGSRFALMACKLMAVHVLLRFDVVATDRTTTPFELETGSFCLLPHDGIRVGLVRRAPFSRE